MSQEDHQGNATVEWTYDEHGAVVVADARRLAKWSPLTPAQVAAAKRLALTPKAPPVPCVCGDAVWCARHDEPFV